MKSIFRILISAGQKVRIFRFQKLETESKNYYN